jgi:hypothetical protein
MCPHFLLESLGHQLSDALEVAVLLGGTPEGTGEGGGQGSEGGAHASSSATVTPLPAERQALVLIF